MTQQYTQKLHPGMPFPEIEVTLEDGSTQTLGQPTQGHDWRMVVVYRGKHCPLCTRYLNELQNHKQALSETGVDVIAVSGDSLEQLKAHKEQLQVDFPLAHGLTVEQMEQLGAFVSDPRSPQETDHPFSEPALFVINDQGNLHVVDISNNPFVRPELAALTSGLKWIRDPDNNYPIRGMHQ